MWFASWTYALTQRVMRAFDIDNIRHYARDVKIWFDVNEGPDLDVHIQRETYLCRYWTYGGFGSRRSCNIHALRALVDSKYVGTTEWFDHPNDGKDFV